MCLKLGAVLSAKGVFTCCQPLLCVHQVTVFILQHSQHVLFCTLVRRASTWTSSLTSKEILWAESSATVSQNNVVTSRQRILTSCWHASSLLVVIYIFRRGEIFDFLQAVNCERLCSGLLTSEPSDVVWWFLLCGLKLCLVTGLFQKVFLCSFRLITL